MLKRVLLLSLFLAFSVYGQIESPEELLKFHQEMQKREMFSEMRKSVPGESYPGARDIDVTYYDISLIIDVDTHVLTGAVNIRAFSRADTLSLFSIDLSSEFSVDSVTGDVSVFSHVDDELSITLNDTFRQGELLECTVHYHGVPPVNNSGFFWANIEGYQLISTLSEPYFARTWWACKDVPEDKADSVDIRVTINDTTMFCVSNGILVSDTINADGTRSFHWKERYPITTYLVSLAISDYSHWRDWYYSDGDSMPVDYWVLEPHRNAAMQNFPKTPGMIGTYASLWGEYPFFNEKYAMAEFSWGGGMEHQTATSVGYSSYWGFGELLIAHELAHQWWGDMVTCANWHHIWVNEGFARYAEALYLEAENGESALSDYMDNINRPRYWMNSSIFIQDTSSFNNIFDLLVYDKGAWVLHMLRHVVGDSLFFQGFHVYRENHSMGVATTEDFRDAMEEASGMDLDWFFDEWIYGVGQPLYTYSWTKTQQSDGWLLELVIHQDNIYGEQFFKMPVDILISYSGGGDTTITVMDSLQDQVFSMTIPDEPSSISFDPENRILKSGAYLSVYGGDHTLPNRPEIVSVFPNPFNSGTSVEYFLNKAGDISIELFDIRGRRLGVLFQSFKTPGRYMLKWNGRIDSAPVPSGVYFICLKSGDRREFRKLVILK